MYSFCLCLKGCVCARMGVVNNNKKRVCVCLPWFAFYPSSFLFLFLLSFSI